MGATPISWVRLQYGPLGVIAVVGERLPRWVRSMKLRFVRLGRHVTEVGGCAPQTPRAFEQRRLSVNGLTGILKMAPIYHTVNLTEIHSRPSIAAAHLRDRPVQCYFK